MNCFVSFPRLKYLEYVLICQYPLKVRLLRAAFRLQHGLTIAEHSVTKVPCSGHLLLAKVKDYFSIFGVPIILLTYFVKTLRPFILQLFKSVLSIGFCRVSFSNNQDLAISHEYNQFKQSVIFSVLIRLFSGYYSFQFWPFTDWTGMQSCLQVISKNISPSLGTILPLPSPFYLRHFLHFSCQTVLISNQMLFDVSDTRLSQDPLLQDFVASLSDSVQHFLIL